MLRYVLPAAATFALAACATGVQPIAPPKAAEPAAVAASADPAAPAAVSPASGASSAAVPALAPLVMRKLTPAITFKDAAGKDRSISEWKGNFTVLMFFSVTCAVCQKEVPGLEPLIAKYGPEASVVPVEATGASAADVAAFASTYKVSMPLYNDPSRAAANAFLVRNYPNAYILSPDQVVQEDVLGKATLKFYEDRIALYAPQFRKATPAPVVAQ